MQTENSFIVTKKFHFYAAHRNLALPGRCSSLHGHCYKVTVSVQTVRDPRTGTGRLFEEVEQPLLLLKERFDHSTILDEVDPLVAVLQEIPQQRLVILHCPSSAENIAQYISDYCQVYYDESFGDSSTLVSQVEVQETETSTIIYRPEWKEA